MSDINDLASRSERLFDAVANVLLGSVEAGVERLEQAGELARLQGRMAVFAATLDAIDAQRAPLLAKLEKATGGMKLLVAKQVDMLNAQEVSVLERAGIGADTARQALAVAEKPTSKPARPGKVVVREHERTRPGEAALVNGTGVDN